MRRTEMQNYRRPKHQVGPVLKYSGVTIEATVNELKQILGSPTVFTDESQYCFTRGKEFMVYDYNETLKIKPNETVRWHIKAYGTLDSKYKKQELLIELNKIRNQ